jgi:hypothetical protein
MVRREGAMITQEHAGLQREIALEEDPDKRHALELRRDIQHADYMALANERIAAMSNLNSEQYEEAQHQQEVWAQIGTELRKERLELQERMANDEMARVERSVEQMAERTNAADQQRAEFRGDIRGLSPAQDNQPETPREAEGFRPLGPDEVLQPGAHVRVDLETGQTQVRVESGPENTPAGPGMQAATPAAPVNGQSERPISEPAGPAEVMYSSPVAPQQEAVASEITDIKAAKKAALAAQRAETEQSIATGQERGYGHSR